MKPFVEYVQKSVDSSFLCYQFRDERLPFDWHYHPEYEIVSVRSGQGQRLVGDHIDQYCSGDLVLLGPNLPHTWNSKLTLKGSRMHRHIVIQFAHDCFGATFFELPEMLPVRRLLAAAACGVQFRGPAADAIGRQMERMPEATLVERLIGLLELLRNLAHVADQRTLSTQSFATGWTPEPETRLGTVLEFIFANYTSSISQTQAAKLIHMSPSTFCRFFRLHTSKTFVEYVTALRIGYACRLLLETDHAISEICFTTGFGNLAHFNRQFRKLKGMPPSQFRELTSE